MFILSALPWIVNFCHRRMSVLMHLMVMVIRKHELTAYWPFHVHGLKEVAFLLLKVNTPLNFNYVVHVRGIFSVTKLSIIYNESLNIALLLRCTHIDGRSKKL